MRKVTLGISTGIIGLLVVGALVVNTNLPVAAQTAPATATVQRTVLRSTIETSGTIEPATTASLSFNTSGQVSEILVQVGDMVTAGQELARLNTSDLEYQLALKQQSLIVQQTSYDRLIADPTAAEIAQAQASVASAQSQVQTAQTNVDSAPNQTVINCTDVDTRQRALDDAQESYDSYILDGYGWDATFTPDTDSAAGKTLRDAQDALTVAQAKCANTTTQTQYDLQLASANASLMQAQATLDSLMSGATAEEIASSQAQLEQAKLDVQSAQDNLADAVLIATFDGIVSENDLVVGQRVNAGAAVMTLVDQSVLHVDIDVDELDIAQVVIGQEAIVRPDALDSVSVTGTVTRIAPVGTNSDGVVTYNVRVDLSDLANLPVRVGMTTDVAITISGTDAVLAVPTEAIQRDGTNEFVEMPGTDGQTRRIPITSGQTADGMTEISGNIAEGDTVIVVEQATNAGTAGAFGAPLGGN